MSQAFEDDRTDWNQIAAEAIAGNQTSFGRLVERYAGMVTGVAYAVLGDFARSEDTGQDAFLEAWRKRDTLHDPAKFPAWVCSIARHRAIDAVRRSARPISKTRPLEASQAENCEFVGDQPSAEDIAITEEERELVWSSLRTLPEKYREAMVLYYRGEESVAEVARSLGESEANVRQRLVRGREMLRIEVQNVVQRALRGTTPTVVFTAAVLGGIPGNVSAAAAGTTAMVGTHSSSTATAGKVGLAKLFGVGASAGISGAIIGTVGGIAGAAFGSYMAYRHSPYQSQKRLIVRYFLILLVAIVIFCLMVTGLVWKQTSGDPMSGGVYATVLLTCIIGFQALLLGTGFLLKRKYQTLQDEGERNDEPVDPVARNRMLHPFNRGVSIQSRFKLLGRPWLDVQLSRKNPVDEDVPVRIARGWIAIGDQANGLLLGMGSRARGLLAFGGRSVGVFAFGAMSVGVVSIGALPLGIVCGGALSVGVVAFGGLALGYWSIGGVALGGYSFGGFALGVMQSLGGMAGSFGAVKAGLVLGGDTSPAASDAISDYWFGDFVSGQLHALSVQLTVLIFLPVLMTVVAYQILRQRVELESGFVESRGNSTKTQHWTGRCGGVLGSLFGCTAWTVGLGYSVDRLDVTILAAVLYGLASLMIIGTAYRDRRAQEPGFGFYLGFALLWIAVTFNLAVCYFHAAIVQIDGIYLSTIALGAQVVFIMHLAFAAISLGAWESDGLVEEDASLGLPKESLDPGKC